MKLDLLPFKSLIKERCGLLFDGDGEERLARALAERIHALALPPADYYPCLIGRDHEFQELVNLLTINETYFFREPEQIRLLVEQLAPRFLAAHGTNGHSGPVRILSAGCSSGEEPYSLAMALLDKYGESVSRLFAFAGSDIDSTVLAKARNARYTDFSFRGVPEAIKQRYFDRDRWGRVLKDEVRRLVEFHELNLLADDTQPALHGFDIIFFRNVSIYFDTPTRRIIQQNLAARLKEDGVLVIGTAETLANDLGVLPLVQEDGLFYFVKGTQALPEAAPLHNPILAPAPAFNALTAPLPSLQVLPAVSPAPTFANSSSVPPVNIVLARELVQEKSYDDALPLLDALLSVTPGNAEARLLKAHVLIERREFAAAEALAQRVLVDDAWSIDAFLMLGLATKWRQQVAEATRWFKQAAYARHECWPAHYYLADIYRQGGEPELAQRAYRVVIQLLSGGTPDTGIRYVPLGLPAGEVRFLCEHQLAKLKGTTVSNAALVGQR